MLWNVLAYIKLQNTTWRVAFSEGGGQGRSQALGGCVGVHFRMSEGFHSGAKTTSTD